ncbi:MAG: FtsQ-type POTRA domain-containing protein [Clostridia bacterium]|nr:FtsQ-type POTRA domain-containing protein [Clostridia bacterium]
MKRLKKNKYGGVKRRGGARRAPLIIAVLAVAAVALVAFTPYFKIKYIKVEGNQHLDDEYITRVSGISVGMNTFSMKLSDVINNLTAESYVDTAKVKREFPNGVSIVVKENLPCAIIPYADGRFILIDRRCRVLEELEVENGEYPEITGMTVTIDGNKKLSPSKEDKDKPAFVSEILTELSGSTLSGRIAEINLKDTDNITLTLNGGKMIANIKDKNELSYKLSFLAGIVEKLDGEGKDTGIIDFSGEDPVYRPEDIEVQPELSGDSENNQENNNENAENAE